ncbi:hypothetical protein sos41_35410 [Alphaproteobacteria bacterium SO-S41]|nr:hypothetical protein sos41_35410 [Alphaproteobacteria bacterium SO-S41]
MTDQRESIWVRAFIRRGADMDVVKEVECDSQMSATDLADELWRKLIYDRVEATVERLGTGKESTQLLGHYGHDAAPTEKAPADFETPIPEAFDVRIETKPQA